MSNARSIRYKLAESYLTVSGTVTYETDQYTAEADKPAVEVINRDKTQATVALAVRGDPQGGRDVSFSDAVSDGTFTVSQLADGRLTAANFNTAGIGARVVATAATVLAYVGGLAATLVGGGTARAVGAITRSGFGLEAMGAGDPPVQTPEEKALAEWKSKHKPAADHRADYETVLQNATRGLKSWRERVIDAETAREAKDALANARRLEAVVADAKAEIDRVDTLYKAWRATTIVSRAESLSYELSIADLGAWEPGKPDVNQLGSAAKDAWDKLGVIVRVQPLSERPVTKPVDDQHPYVGDRGDDPSASERLVWRVPRPVRVWVWRRGKGDAVVLERVSTAYVVDKDCPEADLVVDERFFGEASGTVDFGDLGAPTKISAGGKSAVGALVDALKGTPDAVATGLEAAKKAQGAYVALEDAGEQHRLDMLKRRKDIFQAELDLKGLEATAEDIGRQKRLEQQVAMAEAEGKLASSPPSELDLLKHELELAKTEAALNRVRSGGDPDDDGAPSIEDQLARLTDRVEALEAG